MPLVLAEMSVSGADITIMSARLFELARLPADNGLHAAAVSRFAGAIPIIRSPGLPAQGPNTILDTLDDHVAPAQAADA